MSGNACLVQTPCPRVLGVSMPEKPKFFFRIIPEWVINGSVTERVQSNPEANRLRLVSPTAYTLHTSRKASRS